MVADVVDDGDVGLAVRLAQAASELLEPQDGRLGGTQHNDDVDLRHTLTGGLADVDADVESVGRVRIEDAVADQRDCLAQLALLGLAGGEPVGHVPTRDEQRVARAAAPQTAHQIALVEDGAGVGVAEGARHQAGDFRRGYGSTCGGGSISALRPSTSAGLSRAGVALFCRHVTDLVNRSVMSGKVTDEAVHDCLAKPKAFVHSHHVKKIARMPSVHGRHELKSSLADAVSDRRSGRMIVPRNT